MNRIRDILLTDYIGAITIAFLVGDGVFAIIMALIRTGSAYVYFSRRGSVFDSPASHVQWETLISALLTFTLSLAAALLLARWMYPNVFNGPSIDTDPAEQPPEQTEDQ
jgi:hypothetical protein